MADTPSTKPRIDKVGVKPGARVVVLGVPDEDFLAELAARTGEVFARPRREADLIFFAAGRTKELARLATLKRWIKPNGAIWVVRRKGVREITESDVIRAGKDAGLVDTKVVAFSATHTAEKLVIPVANR